MARPKNAPTPVWISFSKLAEIQNVTVWTVRKWAKDGKLPGLRKTTGGEYRFDRNRIDEIFPEVER